MKTKPILKADFESGEGWVENVSIFMERHDPLMRMDLLSDWIDGLQSMYNNSYQEWHGQLLKNYASFKKNNDNEVAR